MHLPPITSILASLAGLIAVTAWRLREVRTAVSLRKIVIPPLGMATGFCMFIVPAFRLPWLWALGAFIVGALVLAYPLILTSRLKIVGNDVMMHRSIAFFFVVVALAAVRYYARGFFDKVITLEQTAALFFVLAFGMILRWRTSMYFEYRRLTCT
jgi:membrane protein CcdC involved in cytochrome C biogenesis